MMEEQIKYILDMSCEHFVAMPSKCKQRAAKEITAHVMEFAEWLAYDRDRDCKTIEEVYQYWLTNVKK